MIKGLLLNYMYVLLKYINVTYSRWNLPVTVHLVLHVYLQKNSLIFMVSVLTSISATTAEGRRYLKHK